MADYKLIEDLKKEGFMLSYPEISSNDEKIISILKENDSRLNLAIPLLLEKEFSYKNIIKNISKKHISTFNKIIIISHEIFQKERLNHMKLKKIIEKNNIKAKIEISEYKYFYDEFIISKELKKKKSFNKKEFESRENLNMLINLEKIFSPAKIRILRNIYAHKRLTPSEERYYYRSIKPMINSILNNSLRNFLEIILKNKSQR